jgi:hypothetical protein
MEKVLVRGCVLPQVRLLSESEGFDGVSKQYTPFLAHHAARVHCKGEAQSKGRGSKSDFGKDQSSLDLQ